MTKVEAIKKLMEKNDGLASWSLIYQEIDKYYPNAKKSKEWKAGIRGVLYRDIGKTFKKIDNGLFALFDFNEQKYIKRNKVFITERLNTITMRIGQSFFRGLLIKNLKICPFTKIGFEKLLIASHIKPWSESNDIERLDIYNGFIFTPTYDKLFDNGLISFKRDKTLIISNQLDYQTRTQLHIKNNMYIENLEINGRENYLEYHRDVIFQK